MSIDWGAFLAVAIASVIGACVVVAVYSSGLRMWSWADALAGKYSMEPDGTMGPATNETPGGARSAGVVNTVRAGAIACFVISGVVVLYGIYLIVPQFH
jgi:hypothetical protein